MKLHDLIPIDYAIIEWPDDDGYVSRDAILEFANWHSAGKGWMYRIDPPRPEIRQQRHIHITRDRYVRAKSRQASWNVDGSRHDRGAFDEKTGDLAAVKAIAREKLGLKSDVRLELLTISSAPSLLLDHAREAECAELPPILAVLRARKRYR